MPCSWSHLDISGEEPGIKLATFGLTGYQSTRSTAWATVAPPLTYGLIQGEAVVDSRRQRDQVSLPHGDPDPSVASGPDVKVGLAVQDVADLVV